MTPLANGSAYEVQTRRFQLQALLVYSCRKPYGNYACILSRLWQVYQGCKVNLYEILVPTIYGDTLKPISTRHHKSWDAEIRKATGGLTILTPCKGQWVVDGEILHERVIPVRVACDPYAIDDIITFTLKHYRQKAVMFYMISAYCQIVKADGN